MIVARHEAYTFEIDTGTRFLGISVTEIGEKHHNLQIYCVKFDFEEFVVGRVDMYFVLYIP